MGKGEFFPNPLISESTGLSTAGNSSMAQTLPSIGLSTEYSKGRRTEEEAEPTRRIDNHSQDHIFFITNSISNKSHTIRIKCRMNVGDQR